MYGKIQRSRRSESRRSGFRETPYREGAPVGFSVKTKRREKKPPRPRWRLAAVRVLTLDDLSAHVNRLILRPPPPTAATYARAEPSVEVRTLRRKHGANPRNDGSVRAARHDDSGYRPTTATATAAVPHGNIPRTVRTATADVPPEPGAGAVAASATGAGSPATEPGTLGFTAVAAKRVSACGPGDPATTSGAPAAHPGPAERLAKRVARPAGASAAAFAGATALTTGTQWPRAASFRRIIFLFYFLFLHSLQTKHISKKKISS